MRVEIKNNQLILDDKKILLISGTVHYWRLERKLWNEILDKVKEMGFRVIDIYIPWSVHEIEKGKFDFGEVDKNKDLNFFLNLCKEKDIYVLARPGPHINAEITYFGYPKRILAKEDLLSKTAENTLVYLLAPPRMFPVPSYAEEGYYEEVAIYFDALIPIVKKHQYPDGNLIAIQADNEMSLFFRTQPYDHDYSPASIKLYQNFLRDKYKEIDKLNNVYKSNFNSFLDVQPPREFEGEFSNLSYLLDWMEYKEYYIIYSVSRIAEMFKERGITNIPIYHNYPTPFPTTPYNVIRMEEKIDVQGVDIYPYKENFQALKRGISFLSTVSRFPFIPEFSSGGAVIYQPLPITIDDEKFTTWIPFMYGLKGINFYMIVERERWYGSPITRQGKIREEYFEFYKEVNKILNNIDLPNLKRRTDILILLHPEYDRLELATSLVTPIVLDMVSDLVEIPSEYWVEEENLGFRDCIQIEYQRWWSAIYGGLTKSKYSFTLGSTELPEERLKEFKIIFLPTFEFMNEKVQNKILNFVKSGGIAVIGPRAPEKNEFQQVQKIIANYLWKPQTHLKETKFEDLILSCSDVFDAEPFIKTPENKTIGYVREVEKGKIVHLGFCLPRIKEKQVPRGMVSMIDKICNLHPEIKKEFCAAEEDIETSYYESSHKKILFIANPTSQDREVKIEVSDKNGQFQELWPEEKMIDNLQFTLPPFSVKIIDIRMK